MMSASSNEEKGKPADIQYCAELFQTFDQRLCISYCHAMIQVLLNSFHS